MEAGKTKKTTKSKGSLPKAKLSKAGLFIKKGGSYGIIVDMRAVMK